MSELGLGRNQLNTDELRAYLLIEDALKKHATTCDVSKVPIIGFGNSFFDNVCSYRDNMDN